MLTFAVAVLGVGAALMWLLNYRYPWLKTDLKQIFVYSKSLIALMGFVHRRHTLVDVFEERVRRHPDKTFLIFQDNSYSYGYMNQQMNRMAHVAKEKLGLKAGDTVAMFMPNEPAFLWTFFGLAKIGVRVAFLNFNLRRKALLHCFNVADTKTLFLGHGDELLAALEEIRGDMGRDVTIYSQGHATIPPGIIPLEEMIAEALPTNMEKSVRSSVKYSDVLCYIYTSGTTGLPKAARMTQIKCLKAGVMMTIVGIRPDDVLYTPLPLYHSAGGLIGVGNTIVAGATLVLRPKFSARCFWDDCCRHKVTIIQYIGELCRYLVNTPESPYDTQHQVRIAFGNGLRQDIWEDFTKRFKIPIVAEFYAATEGNTGFINIFNKFGAVGRTSPFLQGLLYPIRFVKCDTSSAKPVRGEDGLCIEAALGEPGLMVAPVKRGFEYDGYKDNEEMTQRKIVRNVRQEGDVFFNSGDLFLVDKDYFIYFHDRLGDTFRWRGENVSTIEVANALGSLPWVHDANVYGVVVAGNDGRAGMAVITLTNGHSAISDDQLWELYQHCTHLLASYAMPRFVRVRNEMEMTSTLKPTKNQLMESGYDPDKCAGEQLFYMDVRGKCYRRIDKEVHRQITQGLIRF